MRIDLHCHSKYSKRPSLWIMQKIGCPESFTEPLVLYNLARSLGMDLVTITDHNSIDGCIEIGMLPGTFISEEVTTYFPHDGCKAHVLAYDITENQHEDIMRARENIFDLAAYLNAHGIKHALAHPLFAVNDRLALEHFEQFLLLFKVFELNGDENGEVNDALRRIVANLTPHMIEHLAGKHKMEPALGEMWLKRLIGGSDDHSTLHLARFSTDVPEARTFEEFWQGVAQGKARVNGTPSTPKALAHNVYGIIYQFYKDKLQLDRLKNRDVVLKFIDRCLQRDSGQEDTFMGRLQLRWTQRSWKRSRPSFPESIPEMFRFASETLIAGDPQLLDIVNRHPRQTGAALADDVETRWFDFANKVSDKILNEFGRRLIDCMAHVHFFDVFHSVGSAGSLGATLSPYFVAYSMFAKARRFSAEILAEFSSEKDLKTDRGEAFVPWQAHPAHVGHFTDTLFDTNGVALTIRQQAEVARQRGRNYTVVTCERGEGPPPENIRYFAPVGTYSLSEYEGWNICFPPFLEMLDYAYTMRFTHIHSSTPGPVGLAALAIARILGLPIHATYHTSLPQYAKKLTEDTFAEEVMWKCVLWYYNQMDCVFAPSRATANELIDKGIDEQKIRVYPRGVNIERFHPGKRKAMAGISKSSQTLTVLYVGRVSKEKNLEELAVAFNRLSAVNSHIRLVVVGSGPYLEEMKRMLRDANCLFTGFLQGTELEEAYASSDLFVFPSTTDTFGNVVLEAQASGLPVVITDCGGPQENVIPGKTAVIVPGGDSEALHEAMRGLLNNPARLKAMGRAARDYAEKRAFEGAFLQTYELYVYNS